MKSTALTFTAFFTITLLCGQTRIPNEFFDYWDHYPQKVVGGQTFPEFYQPGPGDFWTTSNQGTRTISFAPTLLRTTDSYKAAGEQSNYAVLMRSTNFPFGVAAGSLIAGTYVGGTNPNKAVKMGRPFTGRPERWVGYYKYIPVNGDYCKAYAVLTKWNGSRRDTIATAEFDNTMQTTTVPSYTRFDLTMNYRSSADPDTVIMIFTASGNGDNFKGGNGSEFYLDYLQFLYPGETGFAENDEDSRVHVFPNPCQDKLQVWLPDGFKGEEHFEVINTSGRVVGSFELSQEVNELDLNDLKSGTYVYRLTNSGITGRLVKP